MKRREFIQLGTKGKKYARCQLLTDPKKPQFVVSEGYCATFVKKT